MNGLVLHCGANHVDIDGVRQAPTPPATASWQPIPHANLYDRVRTTLEGNGLHVVQEAHGLWREGARYFGLLEVKNGDNPGDFGLIVGLRNSHDKSFPAAIALGSRVFVCDNLSFSGEVKLARKHTTFIRRDLPNLVQRAVGQLHDLRGFQDRRIAAYKATDLTSEAAVHDLVVRSVYCQALPGSKIMDVLEQWKTPRHEEFQPRTVWSLFNGFTEVSKGNLNVLPARTQALHGLMDSYCGLAREAQTAQAV